MLVAGIGFWLAFPVYGVRAGFTRVAPGWREYVLAQPTFFLLMFAKAFVWPLVTLAWLAQGRPPSPWRAIDEIDGVDVRRILRIRVCCRSG